MPVRSAFVQIAASTWRKPADPQVFGMVDIDFTAGESFIERYNGRFGARITPTHLVGRAAGLILAKFPLSNAKVGLSRVWLRNSADVYFTIATGGGTDLFGYKVAAVDATRLVDLERTLRGAAKAIRDGSDKGYARSRRIALALPIFILRPFAALSSFATNVLGLDLSSMGFPRDAFGGAVVTSIGMFGLDTGFATVVPMGNSSMCFALMQVRQRPWVVGDRVEPRPVLRICVTLDHRILDGFLSAQVSRELEDLLSHPEKLLTESERAEFDAEPPPR